MCNTSTNVSSITQYKYNISIVHVLLYLLSDYIYLHVVLTGFGNNCTDHCEIESTYLQMVLRICSVFCYFLV